jgi:hypothetical protein
MLSLKERLRGIVGILNASNAELRYTGVGEAGFVAVPPELLAQSMLALLENADITKVSLDLGCGNGGWMLMAAAAGFPSYGIEINTELMERAQLNYESAIAAGYIDPVTPCAWIVGDMIPLRYTDAYAFFRKSHALQEHTMPIGPVVEDAFMRLPTSIATADIIYCWSWPTQSQFIYNMLEDEAKIGAVFIVPSYEQYIRGEYTHDTLIENRLLLTPLSNIQNVYIGRRRE